MVKLRALSPDPEMPLLIYGADAMRVALKRAEAVTALAGSDAAEDMRLTRIGAADLRADPAAPVDALKAVGFFPGQRVVTVEDATDAQAGPILAALDARAPGDAALVVTAGALRPTSKLRKRFEGPGAAALALYDDPPDRAEIERVLGAAGLRAEGPAMAALTDQAQALGPGAFGQLVEALALYKLSDPDPLTAEDVAALAPLADEAAVDAAVDAAAGRRPKDLPAIMARLAAQGVTPQAVLIAASRHFRALHAALGGEAPRLPFPRKRALEAQARSWRPQQAERAMALLTDAELSLRSAGATAPPRAIVARTLLRLAMTRP